MPKYQVKVRRIAYSYKTWWEDAEDEKEAAAKALNKAPHHSFREPVEFKHWLEDIKEVNHD